MGQVLGIHLIRKSYGGEWMILLNLDGKNKIQIKIEI